MVIETNSSYYRGKTDEQVIEQARRSFLWLLRSKGISITSTTTVDSNFNSASTKHIRYIVIVFLATSP